MFVKNFKVSPWIEKNLKTIPKNSNLLDVACGDGRHSVLAKRKGFRVTAIDIDYKKLFHLKTSENIVVLRLDLEKKYFNWTFKKNSFDIILVTNFLYRPILKKILYSIKSSGYLLYETFSEENKIFGRPNNPDYLLNQGELLNFAINNKMKVIEYEEIIDQDKNQPKAIQRIFSKKF